MSSSAALAVLMTSFNRCPLTLACLRTLRQALDHAGVEAALFLVDDGSTDGTAAAVRALWPDVHLLQGRDLYWCRGMHRAFAAAQSIGYPNYLWLNDDTTLRPDALSRLLQCQAELLPMHPQGLIVVGSTASPEGRLTYGGERGTSRWNPLSLALVPPGDTAQPIRSMNGNIVLVDSAATQRLGNLDPTFEHAMGDTDYALRAHDAGVSLRLAPGVHGTCSLNDNRGGFYDTSLPLHRRLKAMLGRKGLPWRSWLHLTRRHGGFLWPLLFAGPYLKVIAQAALLPLAKRRIPRQPA